MTKKRKETGGSAEEKNPQVEQIRALFGEARTHEPTHNMAAARRIERQVAALVAQVAAEHPNTEFHAEALAFHEYTLLSLSRTSKRKSMQKQLRDAAYDAGARAVRVRLKLPRELGTSFAAYNLGIDLVCSEGRPEEGLKYLVLSRRILNSLPKNQIPRNLDPFWTEYGIAKAHYDLGRKDKARRVLRKALRGADIKGRHNRWSALRGIAKCAELLAQVYLDELDAKRASQSQG